MKMYEGLFLIDNERAITGWDNVVNQIHVVLQKNGAEIIKTEKWGEKKLAYKIKGHRRGTYLLIHFNAKSSVITTIKRDFQFVDSIIRFLIVKDNKIEDLSQMGVSSTAEKVTDKIPEMEALELLVEGVGPVNT